MAQQSNNLMDVYYNIMLRNPSRYSQEDLDAHLEFRRKEEAWNSSTFIQKTFKVLVAFRSVLLYSAILIGLSVICL